MPGRNTAITQQSWTRQRKNCMYVPDQKSVLHYAHRTVEAALTVTRVQPYWHVGDTCSMCKVATLIPPRTPPHTPPFATLNLVSSPDAHVQITQRASGVFGRLSWHWEGWVIM